MGAKIERAANQVHVHVFVVYEAESNVLTLVLTAICAYMYM